MKALSLFFVIFAVPLNGISAESEYPIDIKLPGIESRYSGVLVDLANNWPSQLNEKMPDDATRINIQCFGTPGNEYYIGVRQQLLIKATFDRVEAVVDNLSAYAKIFDDLVKVDILEKDKNKWLTFWEQRIPFPFVSNDKTEIFYVLKKSEGIKFYRYLLKKSNNLKFNDGLIVIEKKSPNETIYTELDFWDANWGIAKSKGVDGIWLDSVRGVIQSDFALKMKSEEPTLADDKILDKSLEMAKALPVREWIKNRPEFALPKPEKTVKQEPSPLEEKK